VTSSVTAVAELVDLILHNEPLGKLQAHISLLSVRRGESV